MNEEFSEDDEQRMTKEGKKGIEKVNKGKYISSQEFLAHKNIPCCTGHGSLMYSGDCPTRYLQPHHSIILFQKYHPNIRQLNLLLF